MSTVVFLDRAKDCSIFLTIFHYTTSKEIHIRIRVR